MKIFIDFYVDIDILFIAIKKINKDKEIMVITKKQILSTVLLVALLSLSGLNIEYENSQDIDEFDYIYQNESNEFITFSLQYFENQLIVSLNYFSSDLELLEGESFSVNTLYTLNNNYSIERRKINGNISLKFFSFEDNYYKFIVFNGNGLISDYDLESSDYVQYFFSDAQTLYINNSQQVEKINLNDGSSEIIDSCLEYWSLSMVKAGENYLTFNFDENHSYVKMLDFDDTLIDSMQTEYVMGVAANSAIRIGNYIYVDGYSSVITAVDFGLNFNDGTLSMSEDDYDSDEIYNFTGFDSIQPSYIVGKFGGTEGYELDLRVIDANNGYVFSDTSLVNVNQCLTLDEENCLFIDRSINNGFEVYQYSIQGHEITSYDCVNNESMSYHLKFFYSEESLLVADSESNIIYRFSIDLTENQNETTEPNISNISNYPNPFNPKTTISFEIQKDAFVELSILNIKGQVVDVICNQELEKGKHSYIWNGNNKNGKPCSSGVYFFEIKTKLYQNVSKCILLK